MKVVGLTGSIGSGKSEVAGHMQQLGAVVIDADVLAREVVAPGSREYTAIRERFGDAIVQADGTINRSALGALIFQNSNLRRELEAIVHPAVRRLFSERLAAAQRQDPDALVLAVIPLLFETDNTYSEIESVIVVHAPEEDCIERIMKRDSCSRELAQKKLSAQLPQHEKVARADYTICNDSSLADLHKRAEAVFQQIIDE